jgi:hypothetical protein
LRILLVTVRRRDQAEITSAEVDGVTAGSSDCLVLRGDDRRFLNEPMLRSDFFRRDPIRLLLLDGLPLPGDSLATSGLVETNSEGDGPRPLDSGVAISLR